MSRFSCLVAQLTVMLDRICQSFQQAFSVSLTLNQMHVVVFSESVFDVEIYCFHLTYRLVLFVFCVVLCQLVPRTLKT